MAQKFYKVSPDVPLDYFPSMVAKNSEVFAVGDPVAKSSGLLIVATAGLKVLGFAVEAFTAAADNQTVAKKMPRIIPAYPGVQMQYTADQAAVVGDIGQYCDLVGTTGAIKMDLPTSATAGAFVVIGYDPEQDGTTTEVIVEVAEPTRLAFAQV